MQSSGNARKKASGDSGKTGRGLQMRFRPYDLHLRHVFTISGDSRAVSPVVLVEVGFEGLVGYGEAALPPYLGESLQSVLRFLKQLDLSRFHNPLLIHDILEYVDRLAPGNFAAKASIDIALHDLAGKLMQQPCHRIWGLNPERTPHSSFTIGIDSPAVVARKSREAASSSILKVKLGRGTDKEIINAIRTVTAKPLYVDVNQGWTDKHEALDMIHWLKDQGVVLVEQPMPAGAVEEMAWLTQHSPLPTVADEAVQVVADVKKMAGVYSGINIKLMKCGGMRAALKMAAIARGLDLEVMLGCMVETSCAVSAAAQLSPLAKWCDLDGNLLITNDVFDGMKIVDGKVTLSERPGIGAVPLF